MRGKLLFVLAIANALSPDDFVWVCDSYIQRASRITFIRCLLNIVSAMPVELVLIGAYSLILLIFFLYLNRNDGMEDRYSVLIEFDDQMAADRFYLELNGWRFPSSDVVSFFFLGVRKM